MIDLTKYCKAFLILICVPFISGDVDTCTTSENNHECTGILEKTFIAVKPDGVQRRLVGEIIGRFEKKGFKLVAMNMVQANKEILELHYEEHKDKNFFPSLIKYMSSGPIVIMTWEGKGVVEGGRNLLGATNPIKASPGTIRGDLGMTTGRNLCHASDSKQSAQREIKLWFGDSLISDWTPVMDQWIYE